MLMVLYEDTRNQVGKHRNIHAYCQQAGIKLVRQALNVGDYMLAGSSIPVVDGKPLIISADTKMDVRELAMDVFQSHRRFRDECLRAQEQGIQLIVLVEESLPGGRLENWRSPIGRDGLPLCRFDPARLKKTLITMQERYGVKFRFCDGRSTGKVLIEYLKGERQ